MITITCILFPCGPCGCAVYARESSDKNILAKTFCGNCKEEYTINFKEMTVHRLSDNKTYPLGILNGWTEEIND